MSLRKKAAEKTEVKGPPARKSMAGPILLGTFSTNASSKRGAAAEAEPVTVQLNATKDYQNVDGHLKITQILHSEHDILCCKFSETFNYLAVGCSDGSALFYPSDTNEPFVLTDGDIQSANAPLTAMKHRPVSKNYPISNCFTCTYGNGQIKCWNYNFQQCIYSMKEKRECYGLTYHPRYPKYITYGDDCKIYLYDEESRTQERILSSSNSPQVTDGHNSRVFSACFNPRSNYELITGGWDDVICFWDLRQPYAIRHLSGAHICGEGLDINLRGTEILACSFQKSNPIQLFDYGSGKLIGKMDSSSDIGKLYAGKFLSKDYAAIGGAAPNNFQIVDLNSFVVVAGVTGMPSAIYSLDIGAPSKGKPNTGSDLARLNGLAYISGKKIFQVEFI